MCMLHTGKANVMLNVVISKLYGDDDRRRLYRRMYRDYPDSSLASQVQTLSVLYLCGIDFRNKSPHW